MITAENESFLFATIHHVAEELESKIFALNGTSDHIHIATAIPPKYAIAQWVKRCKWASSHAINQTFTNEERFHWQAGYGVLSLGYKSLEYVMNYIKNQKLHHTNNTLQLYLERIDPEDEPL